MTVDQTARTADARLGVLVLAAEDMYAAQGPGAVEPVLDPRLTVDWELRGYITGTDAIFRFLGKVALGMRRVFYGLLLESKSTPGDFVCAIRGTSGAIEWGEDFQGLPCRSRYPGLVESGFAGIEETFAFRHPGSIDMPLVASLSAIVYGGGALTVVGHSLGSALATYVAYEAAQALPGRVSLRVFASPHPGNSEFAQAVAAVVPNHRHWRNPNDVVPDVPIALGYVHLPNTIMIGPSTDALQIDSDWGCSHHLLSYLALLDSAIYESIASGQDQPYLYCIRRTRTAA
jgi:triacylglycerol lipase